MENVLKAQTLVLDLTVIYMEVMKMPAMMMFAARGMEGKVQMPNAEMHNDPRLYNKFSGIVPREWIDQSHYHAIEASCHDKTRSCL